MVIKGGSGVYCLAGFFYLINPIYSYYSKNEIIPLVPVFMIFIDETTRNGFVLLAMIHLTFMVVTVAGTAGTDFKFVMIIVNMPTCCRPFSLTILKS